MKKNHGLYLLVVLAFLVSASRITAPALSPQPLGSAQTGSSSASPQSISRIIYGPEDGSIIHYTGKSTIYPTGVNVSDFWTNVTFYNPFSTDNGTWDYGISFRVSSDAWMLLAVKSSKEWSLMCAKNGGFEYPFSGTVDNLDVSPNGKNTIELSAYGTQGHFFVNGELISNLDLSCTTAPGDVNLRVGWLVSAYDGHETRFTNLTIGRDPNETSATEGSVPPPTPPRTNGSSVVEEGSVPPPTPPRTNGPVVEQEQPGSASNLPDSDQDGITDLMEEWFATTYVPYFEFDEDEHNIMIGQDPEDFGQGDGVFYLHQVSIVNCDYLTDSSSGEHIPSYEEDPNPFGGGYRFPNSVLVTLLEIFPYDYLPYKAWIGEDDVFAHNGDIESIKICLRDDNRDEFYDIAFIHVRRHGHDHVYRPDQLEMIGLHPKLYASEGKHATYISTDECENAISSWEWWSWDEDCGEGREIITPVTTINYNVGEYYPGKSMTLEDFGIASHFEFSAHSAGIGYLSEHVWTTHINTWNRETYFCGGALVKNFTERHQVINPGYDEVNCPGGLHYKWWIRLNM